MAKNNREDKLYNKLTEVLGYHLIGDEDEISNLDTLVTKYIYGLRNLEVDKAKNPDLTDKELANNLNKINEFFNLYDRLHNSTVQREIALDNSKLGKLDALNKVREIKAVVIESKVDEVIEEIAEEIESEEEENDNNNQESK